MTWGTDSIILAVLILLLYILFPWFIISQAKKDENRNKNMPPELWRVNNWHLIDKIKVFNFLKEDLKKISKPKQGGKKK